LHFSRVEELTLEPATTCYLDICLTNQLAGWLNPLKYPDVKPILRFCIFFIKMRV